MPSKSSDFDETPTLRPGRSGLRPPLSPEDPAIRVKIGRFTVDVVPVAVEGGLEAIVSTGELGEAPVTGTLPIGAVALLADAGFVRDRRVIDTAGWASPAVKPR